jgi:hypothetical protein
MRSIFARRDQSSYRIGEIKHVISTSLSRHGVLVNRLNLEIEVDTVSVYVDYYVLIKAAKWSNGTGYVPQSTTSTDDAVEFDTHDMGLTMSKHFGCKRILWYWKRLRTDKRVASLILAKLSAPRYDYAGDLVSILSISHSTNVAPAIVKLIKIMLTGSRRQTRLFGMYSTAVASLLLVSDSLIGYSLVLKGPVDGSERSTIISHLGGDNPKTNPTAPADHHHESIVTADCVVGVSLTLYYL